MSLRQMRAPGHNRPKFRLPSRDRGISCDVWTTNWRGLRYTLDPAGAIIRFVPRML
jgi:hypothetical protein